jgi:hypothetical protein
MLGKVFRAGAGWARTTPGYAFSSWWRCGRPSSTAHDAVVMRRTAD